MSNMTYPNFMGRGEANPSLTMRISFYLHIKPSPNSNHIKTSRSNLLTFFPISVSHNPHLTGQRTWFPPSTAMSSPSCQHVQ